MESRHNFRQKKGNHCTPAIQAFLMLKNSNSHYNIMVKISILLKILARISPKFDFLMLLSYPILSQKPMYIG